MDKERYDKGLAVRTEVLGAEYVERSLQGADDFNREFQEMVTEYAWGGSWGRGLLAKRERSILNLGMLAALGRSHEFALHFRGAIRNGLSLDELKEVLLQIAIYCGVPAGVESFRIARAQIDEMREKGEL